MTKIIKIAENHYRYGDIEMEVCRGKHSDCGGCPIDCNPFSETNKLCRQLIGDYYFKLKENKTTETTKIFTIDNGDKQFSAKLWLEERNLCFQVLAVNGEFKITKNVCFSNASVLNREEIAIPREHDVDFDIDYCHYKTNTERDKHFTKACGWLQEFCDKNSVVERFDQFDVIFTRNAEYCYRDECGDINPVFYLGMAKDSFAGIKYKGNEAWFMDRKLVVAGNHLSSCICPEEEIEQAIPEKIRFFKETK